MLEKDVERKLREGVKKEIPKAKCLKFVSPGFVGIPDRIILLPGGVTVFVELKRQGKTERQRQLFVQASLRKLGFTVFSTIDSPEKAWGVVEYCKGKAEEATRGQNQKRNGGEG